MAKVELDMGVGAGGLGDLSKSSMDLVGDEYDCRSHPTYFTDFSAIHTSWVEDPHLKPSDPLVKLIPAPVMLLDGAEGLHVVAVQAERRFGAIDLCSPLPVLANLG